MTEAAEQAQELPALALNRGLEIAGKAQETYETVAARGEKLVKRVRTQKSTKDLLAQAEATFALGKGAVTTVRKSATDIQRSAKATLTTGRKEAAVAADAIADSVVDEATEATTTVKQVRHPHPHRCQAHRDHHQEVRRHEQVRHQGRDHQRQEDGHRHQEGQHRCRQEGRRLTSPPAIRPSPVSREGAVCCPVGSTARAALGLAVRCAADLARRRRCAALRPGPPRTSRGTARGHH